MTNEQLHEIVDYFLDDYNRKLTYDTRLYELFCKHDEAVAEYIKEGRKFWHFDNKRQEWRKITITYVRTGVMFFVCDDEPETELAWFINSINCLMLHAAEIYPEEIGEILSKWYPDAITEFPKICRNCKWDDNEGNIKIEVF